MKFGRYSFFAVAIAIVIAFNAPGHAALIGSITHDYGKGENKVDLSGMLSDEFHDDYVLVDQSSSQRFYDFFNFNFIDYENIDAFELTLQYSHTNGGGGLAFLFNYENWHVRPAISPTEAVPNNEITSNLSLNRVGSSIHTKFFNFTSTNINSIFDDIVDNGIFYLWFAQQGRGSHDFRLYSAQLDIYGTLRNPTPNPVPEPGTIALLGIGLVGMGLYGYRRKINV